MGEAKTEIRPVSNESLVLVEAATRKYQAEVHNLVINPGENEQQVEANVRAALAGKAEWADAWLASAGAEANRYTDKGQVDLALRWIDDNRDGMSEIGAGFALIKANGLLENVAEDAFREADFVTRLCAEKRSPSMPKVGGVAGVWALQNKVKFALSSLEKPKTQ